MNENEISEIIKEAGLMGGAIKSIGAPIVKGLAKGTVGFSKAMGKATVQNLNQMYNPKHAGKIFAPLSVGLAGVGLATKTETPVSLVAPWTKGVGEATKDMTNSIKDTVPVPEVPSLHTFASEFKEGLEEIEKQAALNDMTVDENLPQNHDSLKNMLMSVGLGVGAGSAGYIGFNRLADGIERASENQIAQIAMNNAVGQAGKNVMNAATKNRPGAKFVQTTMAQAGKAIGQKGNRLNFNTLHGGPPLYKTLGSGAALLGLLAATATAEDYLADKIKNKVEMAKLSEEYKQDLLEKCAYDVSNLSNYKSRLIAERIIKPVVTTSVFLGSLGTLSHLTGRNLYGGFEKIQPPVNTDKIVVDIPNSQLEKDKVKVKVVDPDKILDKQANVQGEAVEAISDAADKSTMLKNRIDNWVANKGPKGLRDVHQILAQNHDYKGDKGIGHFMVEEVPFKMVEGLAYVAPMAVVAGVSGRNLKRGFAPIDDQSAMQQTPQAPPPGTTRLILEKGPEQKID